MKKTIGIVNKPANSKIIENLSAKGFKVLFLPDFAIEKTKNDSELNNVVNNLLNFDWLFFTDIFAVDYFVKELIQRNFDLFELDNLRICAYGEIVADRLRFSQIHADVIPTKLSDKIILKDLENYIASDNEIKYLSFLLIRGENAVISIKNELQEVSKNITEISVYSANIKEYEGIAKIKVLINSGAFDEIMFFSAEDLQMFKMIYGKVSFKDLCKNVKLTSKNETVQKSIEELNF